MATRSLILKGSLAIALLAIGAYAWFASAPAKPAPILDYTLLSGERMKSGQLTGKVVLVNFWATSCSTCIKEMPTLIDLHKKYEARGYRTLAVAMNYDPRDYVANYVQKAQLPFMVALDSDGAAARAFGDIRLTPTTFLIDRKGHIVMHWMGEPDVAKLSATLEKLLSEPA